MTATPDASGRAFIAVRKYGTDVRAWGTLAADGSDKVEEFSPDFAQHLAEHAREGWTQFLMYVTKVGGSSMGDTGIVGDVHPNLQARCEHGSWWDRFKALPVTDDDAADEAAMIALMAEFDAVFGDEAGSAWMLLIGAESYPGKVDDRVRRLLAMQGRPLRD